MPTYEALIDIPEFTYLRGGEQRQTIDFFVESLREMAYPRIHVEIEAKSRIAAARLLTDSTGSLYTLRDPHQFDEQWWYSRLTVVRKKGKK